MEAKLAHVNQQKKQEVEIIKKLLKEYPVMGVINLENLPAAHFLKIKYKLREKLHIRVTKKRLMKIAFSQLEKEKKDISKVNPLLKGIPALLFTKEDEFKLQKTLNKNKTSALAKPGQIANKDIYVKAGPTQFSPGPMIGEFGVLGIKTQVIENKIHIKEEKLLIKEGEVISSKIASMLSKLGIEPMEIGLNLMFTYKNGEILLKDYLNVNEQEYLENLKKAYTEALNLAVGSAYLNKDTINLLIRKAYLNASALESKTGNLNESQTPMEESKKAETQISTENVVIEKKETELVAEKEKVFVEVSSEKDSKEESSLNKKLNNSDKIEYKNANNQDQKQVADILRQLTDKKIRGEI